MDQCCRSPFPFKTPEGFIVCKNCGASLSEENYEDLWETHTNAHKNFRGKQETEIIPWCHIGYRTSIAFPMASFGKNNINIARFYRLEKMRSRFDSPAHERHLKKIFFILSKFVAYLNNRLVVPEFVIDSARKIYLKKYKQTPSGFMQGYHSDVFVYAFFYVISNQYNVPVLKNDIVEMLKPLENAERLINVHLKLVHRVFKEYIVPKIATQHRLIDMFAQQMHYDTSIIEYAHQLFDYVQKRIFVGRSVPIISAILYVSAKSLNLRSSQNIIAKICHISEVSLRNNLKRIGQLAKTNLFLPYFWKSVIVSTSSVHV